MKGDLFAGQERYPLIRGDAHGGYTVTSCDVCLVQLEDVDVVAGELGVLS